MRYKDLPRYRKGNKVQNELQNKRHINAHGYERFSGTLTGYHSQNLQ